MGGLQLLIQESFNSFPLLFFSLRVVSSNQNLLSSKRFPRTSSCPMFIHINQYTFVYHVCSCYFSVLLRIVFLIGSFH